MQPMTGLYPVSDLTTNTLTTSPQTYTNGSAVAWNTPNAYNTQGQNWTAVTGTPYYCYNKTTDRTNGTSNLTATLDFSFVTTATKLDIQFFTGPIFDVQVYAEYCGQMMRLTNEPMQITTGATGAWFRNIQFATSGARRIRVIASSFSTIMYFTQVQKEAGEMLMPGPTRPMFIADGDSYFESTGNYSHDSARASYGVGCSIDKIIELTGWACWRAGEGGTGYFNNGSFVDSTTEGTNNMSEFFSTQRMSYLATPLAQKPILYLVNGTINDRTLNSSSSAMTTRALAGFDKIRAIDPGCPIVAIGPEPVSTSGVAPVAGDASDSNRLGIKNAIAQHPSGVGFIDPRNIAAGSSACWFFGTATNQSPPGTTDQQGLLIGGDNVHPNYYGHQYYGERIVSELRNIRIPANRAHGIS